jgi:arginyl-tRNA synthetase
MNIVDSLVQAAIQGAKQLYDIKLDPSEVTMNVTRKEFVGDYTLVVFPLTKHVKKNPESLGQELGEYLKANASEVKDFNVVKGFLNLVVEDQYWLDFLNDIYPNPDFGRQPRNGRKVMVEFCSPNTNKPLHLGHIRNMLLGWATYKIYDAAGFDVVRVQIINDRGVAICKSMWAWQTHGQGATPESSKIKGDHLVGDYYVAFERHFQEEYKNWQSSPTGQAVFTEKKKEGQDEATFFKSFKDLYFNEHSKIGAEVRAMLLRWEANDPATISLWKQMNGWVYAGFEETYHKLGVAFDKLYYESNTYLLGKDIAEQGLADQVFYKQEDGSVWIDLEDVKLDKKIILRRDGTSVYMTQDLGTAELRYQDFACEKMIYVVADEQNYHFQVLFEIMKRLKRPYAEGLFHLSYGMVDLTTGKMKSREGTVVDADDLVAEVIEEASKNSHERGTLAELTAAEQSEVVRKIGLAALKFFIVKVHPKKRMTFNPEESVDMQGQTGPYVQNAYVRCSSMLSKAGNPDLSPAAQYTTLETQEKDLISQLYQYPELIVQAAKEHDPSMIASYSYELAKNFHRFWHDFRILQAESEAAKAFRIKLSMAVRQVLRSSLDLLGIEAPEKM